MCGCEIVSRRPSRDMSGSAVAIVSDTRASSNSKFKLEFEMKRQSPAKSLSLHTQVSIGNQSCVLSHMDGTHDLERPRRRYNRKRRARGRQGA